MSGAVIALLAVAVLSNSASGLLASFAYMLFAGWTVSTAIANGPVDVPEVTAPTRHGLVIAWMPNSRRSKTLSEMLGSRLMLLGRPGFRQPWSAALLYPFMALRSCAIILRERPNSVIVVAPPFVAPLVIVPLCALLGIPVAVDIHSGALLDRRWRWSVPLLAWITRRATTGIVTLQNLAEDLERYGVRPVVVADPLPHLQPSESSGMRTAQPAVVAICGWGDDEPIEELVEAAASRPWSLTITGRPRRDLRLPNNVRLTGFMTDTDYAALLSTADLIVVLTTREDTLLSGAWEALSLEQPLLVSNTDALSATFGPTVACIDNSAGSIRTAVESRLRDPDAKAEAARLARRYRIENDRAVSALRQSLVQAAG